MQDERISDAMGAGHGEHAPAIPRACPACSKLYLVVPGADGATAGRCPCGGVLVPAALSPGLYEITDAAPKKKRSKKGHPPVPALETPREADQGYNESHGYGPAHGGPTSPGDAPAADDPIEPENPVR